MEKTFYQEYNPYSLFDKALSVNYPQDKQRELFPDAKGYGDQADAFRHMLWMATLRNKYGYYPAKGIGLFKEFVDVLSGNATPMETGMDLNNNQVALDLFKGVTNQKELERLIKILAKQAKPVKTKKDIEKIGKSMQPMYMEEDVFYNPNMRITPDPFEDSLK